MLQFHERTKISVMKPRSREKISQEELEKLAQKLAIRAAADAAFQQDNRRILEKLRSGAEVEPGEYVYSENQGVKKMSQ